MAYIPEGMNWYIAEVVQEYRVVNEKTSRIWVNTHLIHASSPEEAYEKAVELGQPSSEDYVNHEGQIVQSTFRGLAELLVVQEEPVDGAELIWSEYDGLTEEEVQEWISPKERLSVFAPDEPLRKTPYLPY